MLLTTHYLEEAEALCGRIAMLKAGRVVALDRTHGAARAASPSTMLRFKLDSRCRRRLRRAAARVTGRIVQISALDDYARGRVDCWRCCARQACDRGPRDRPRRPRGRVPRDHAGRDADGARHEPSSCRRACMSRRVARLAHAALQGGAALLEGELPDRRRAGADGGALPADLRPRARGPGHGVRRRSATPAS